MMDRRMRGGIKSNGKKRAIAFTLRPRRGRAVMKFDGVFIATGAHLAKLLGIPGENLPGISLRI
jgi:hypothetical protein